VLMIFIALFAATSLLMADEEKEEVYLSGNTNTSAGDFVVHLSEDLYHFQGRVHEVYKVSYDNTNMNMKIAVNTEGDCKSFVAYNGEFTFFYNCNKFGFGVRKVMFDNFWAHEQFSAEQYHQQSIMKCDKIIDKKDAVRLIAVYVPMLYRGEISN